MQDKKKERAVEMYKMRLDGATFEEIGEKFGVSKQRVSQIIGIGYPQMRKYCFDYIIYPGVKKWAEENNVSCTDMRRIVNPGKGGSGNTKKKLSGKVKLNINDINRLIQATGKTYEYLFVMDEQEIEEADESEM